MTDRIRFLLGGEKRELAGIDPTLTVLNYLRRSERRPGTKEGCAEGDCGACTVVLGELDGDGLRYRAVNSCIQFMPTLNGKQLITVEDLRAADGTLHPCQQAMVETHGSQCGFCTPGFVMSLFALFHGGHGPSRDEVNDALAGNLCRCTGYGPIVAAATRMHEIAGSDQFDEGRAATIAALKAIQPSAAVATGGSGRRCFSPARLDELMELASQHPTAVFLAGGTDVGLWVTKQHRSLDPVIYLGGVAELQGHRVTDTHVEIGAAATYSDLHEVIARHYPDFGEVIRRLGSTQIRNTGTMGGNIANGSPIGDSPPPLIALGATLVLRSKTGRRELPLEEFFIDYGKQDRRVGEFVELIRLPLPRPDWQFRCYKISKRFDQDITAALGAFNARIVNGRVGDIRICFGGMAATPRRALACEAALEGQAWSQDSITRAQLALRTDYQPITDMRASQGYRARVAENLLLKFFIETTDRSASTRVLEYRRAAHG
jgi:xanthine dehydrogenase small subunit